MDKLSIDEIRIIGRIVSLGDYNVLQELTKRALFYSLILCVVFSIPALLTIYRFGPISGTCFLLVLVFSGFLMSFGTHFFSKIAIQLNDQTLRIEKSHGKDFVIKFDSVKTVQLNVIRILNFHGEKWRFAFCDERGNTRSEIVVIPNEDSIKLRSALANSVGFRASPFE